MKPTIDEAIAARLKHARMCAGLTQERLAELTKKTQPQVSGWERGTHGMTLASAKQVARVLRVKPEWLLFGIAA